MSTKKQAKSGSGATAAPGRAAEAAPGRAAEAAPRSASLAFALAAAELASNTRSENVVVLDLRSRSPVTEYFVIATGSSPRQMRTVIDELRDLGKKMSFRAWKMDGYESARWIVLDCVNVVVHLFDNDNRDFYDLELLWGDCPRVNWRRALGLPPEESNMKRKNKSAGDAGVERYPQGMESGRSDEMEAEEEEARLEGRNPDEEEGDADVDEDAETDVPVVVELPDLSTGSNSVEFVEIDPPAKRRQRGRAVYPTPLEEQEDTTAEERSIAPLRSAVESLDEDDQQRAAEVEADRDVEAVSKEDLPMSRQTRRPMGGVSAGLSSTTIGGGGSRQEDQDADLDAKDAEQDHRDEIPEAHEAAAEAIRIGDVELTTEEPGQRPRRKILRTRADMKGPTASAPGPGDARKSKAGVVKAGKKGAVVKKVAAKGGKGTRGGSAKKSSAKEGLAKKGAAKKPGAAGKKKKK